MTDKAVARPPHLPRDPSPSKSAERKSVSNVKKLVCHCGTSVLFPGNVRTRTCWKCNTTHTCSVPDGMSATESRLRPPPLHERGSTSPSPPSSPGRATPSDRPTLSSRPTPTGPGSSGPPSPSMRPLSGPPSPNMRPGSPPVLSDQALSPDQRWDTTQCLLLVLIIVILLVAAAGMTMFYYSTQAEGAKEQTGRLQDTDGDGIPDKDDFCPGKRGVKGIAWSSGRATDFDSDGCEDGREDGDRDNDGVLDSVDRCPNTPQHYGFVSSALSDFDSDGCADGLEDADDDGDGTPNSLDSCPQTSSGDTSDSGGCSAAQRQAIAEGRVPKEVSPWWEATVSRLNGAQDMQGKQKEQEEPKTWQDEWYVLIRGAWVEVILGAVLTSITSQGTFWAQDLVQKAPKAASSANDSVRRMSSHVINIAPKPPPFSTVRRISTKIGHYILIFCFIHYCRIMHQSMSVARTEAAHS
eukprot:gnl/TRDRNA2_/TRDRNA2_133829_c0_seq2.p1 gnl/TRDRNA2_/TRDRNA2_133829_c0~~gnl/TRDRNA2_/TRDRNA2_133829_c0_seq2.p1  ORF type:complete len:466 (+),score=42.95 gnl/TRDRNA2_/TRDRNA2_133829_c0_seq2:90-1487(+)